MCLLARFLALLITKVGRPNWLVFGKTALKKTYHATSSVALQLPHNRENENRDAPYRFEIFNCHIAIHITQQNFSIVPSLRTAPPGEVKLGCQRYPSIFPPAARWHCPLSKQCLIFLRDALRFLAKQESIVKGVKRRNY